MITGAVMRSLLDETHLGEVKQGLCGGENLQNQRNHGFVGFEGLTSRALRNIAKAPVFSNETPLTWPSFRSAKEKLAASVEEG
jgi:hypothetical protein